MCETCAYLTSAQYMIQDWSFISFLIVKKNILREWEFYAF